MRENLQTLTVRQIKDRAASVLTRNGLIVAAVGDIDAAELSRQLDRTFGGLPAGAARPALPDWTPPTKPRSVNVERPVPQKLRPDRPAGDPARRSGLACRGRAGAYPGRRPAVAPVQRGAREARPGLQRLLRRCASQRKASLLVVATGSASEKVADSLRVIEVRAGRVSARA